MSSLRHFVTVRRNDGRKKFNVDDETDRHCNSNSNLSSMSTHSCLLEYELGLPTMKKKY